MKQLLFEAKHEILSLRRQNEILRAKVEVVEVFSAALLGPRTPQVESLDIAWSIQRKIEELDTAEKAPGQL